MVFSLAGLDLVSPTLANLVGKSLLTPDPSTIRYTVHELLCQYAEAELEGDPQRCGEVRAAHADFYGDLTQRAKELFFLSAQVRVALDRDEEAVEQLATVCAHPLSDQQPLTVPVPIREKASKTLQETRSRLDRCLIGDSRS